MSKNEFGRSFQHYENYFECSEHASNPEHFNYAIVKFFHRGIEPEFDNEMDQFLWKMIRPSIACSRRQSDRGQGAPLGNNNSPNGRRGNNQSNNQSTKQSANQTNRNRNRNKNLEDSLFGAEGDAPALTKTLSFPYSSQKFADTWKELRSQPKWKRKTMSALQKNLDQLGKYPEEYAIILMDQAIANGYQGVVFPNTSTSFENWKKNNPDQTREGRTLSMEDLV